MALSRMGAVGRTSGALPSALRSAAALHASRRSFSWFSWGKEEEEDPKFFERQLHRLYSERVVPLEKKYNFPKFATPALRKADFLAAPMVLLLGQYSTGKTSMIQYLTGKQVPGAHVGPEPTTDKFVAVMHGDTERQTPGHAACSDTDLPFHSLTAYGSKFLGKFEIAQLDSEMLRNLTIIDSPGVLSGQKQATRGYDYPSVTKHFADRADRILLLFDCSKLDISDEFKEVVGSIDGNHDKVRCLLNKADQVGERELFRVYGALLWSLGNVVRTPEVLRVFVASMIDGDYTHDKMADLFDRERNSVINDLKSLPRDTRIRRINETVKRWRAVKTHAILCTHLASKFSWMSFSKADDQVTLLAGLEKTYKELARRHNLNVGDFPDPAIFRRTVREANIQVWDWEQTDDQELEAMEKAMTDTIHELLALAEEKCDAPAEEL